MSTRHLRGQGSDRCCCRGDDLVYLGSVRREFKERQARELRAMMDTIKQKSPPIEYDGRRKGLVWLQPTLIANIEYRAWTGAVSCGIRRIRVCETYKTTRRSIGSCEGSNALWLGWIDTAERKRTMPPLSFKKRTEKRPSISTKLTTRSKSKLLAEWDLTTFRRS
jgi:hypothetical protein